VTPICLATQHADAAFAPLALLYLKAALVARRQVRAEEVAILEFPRDASADEIARRILDRPCRRRPVVLRLEHPHAA